VSERIIESVISHQFSSAFQATSHNNEIELSGFGKFLFSQTKAHKQMAKYVSQVEMYNKELANPELSPEKERNLNMRLAATYKNIEHLKPKLIPYEPKSNI
jgi:hypothetical protein